MAPRKNSSKNPRKESVDSGYGPSVTSSLRKDSVASSKPNTATKSDHPKDISDAESPEEFDSIYDNFTPQEKVEFHQMIDKILDELSDCLIPSIVSSTTLERNFGTTIFSIAAVMGCGYYDAKRCCPSGYVSRVRGYWSPGVCPSRYTKASMSIMKEEAADVTEAICCPESADLFVTGYFGSTPEYQCQITKRKAQGSSL